MELPHRSVAPVSGARKWVAAARLVVPLDGTGHRLGLVGGKAASLDALVRRGFHVPPAFAVTTAAYRRFVSSSPDLDEWLDELPRRSPPPPDQAPAARADVERRFLAAPLPSDLVAAVAAHLSRVAPDGAPVAVRSSATTEDLEATSFAGQHLTVLGVEDLDEVLDALRRVWASLWYPAPRVYRHRMGVREADLAMATVVQRLVPAERSGVCFTLDPTRPDTLRLEVVEGLGEALVSGQATPEVHQLRVPSLRPIDGGPLDPVLRDVARAALRIEEEMGGRPQDVEWSVVGDEIWLLQSRPVTTLPVTAPGDGFDTPNRSGDLYAPAGVSEMLPGVLPPLLWTINGPMLEEGFRRLFARLGVLPGDITAEPFAMLTRIQGQAALDLTRVKEAARRMAGGTGAEVERQYLGQVVSEFEDEPRPTAVQRLGNLGASVRALRLRRAAEEEAETFERAVDEVLALRTDLHELRSSELVAYRARVRDLAAAGVAAEIAVAVAAVASYRALEVALQRWVDVDKASRWAQRLTRDAAGGTRGACGCAATIWSVFQDVADSDELEAAIAEATPETAEERLRSVGPIGEALVTHLWGALDRLGSAAVYAGPTWSEQPGYVWQTILGCLRSRIERGRRDPLEEARQGAADALALLERRLTSTTRWKVTRVLTGQIVDVRLRMLRNLVDNARGLLSRRESVKSAVLALGGEERRAIRVLADRLRRRGVLRSPLDIDLFADWELEAAVAGEDVLSRDELERRGEALRVFREGPSLGPLVDHHGQPVTVTAETGAVVGWGASAGIHRGRVRIVHDAAASGDLEPGDVLVAASTDPSWTPLFLVAGAVVVERGGPLSHAAIVARELGVPAVLNAVGATRKLADGMLVEVDGEEGRVTVLDVDANIDLTAVVEEESA